ncbi:hypothetical protein [Leeuwenhoekiella marinoflava]|uniref:hypothetical protein n=1 Tax=Leeuwenhoekiella marinoflava TaxID=988 RepID=UPI00300126C8
MDKDEHDKIKKELAKLNLSETDRLKLEVEELKTKLSETKKEFNEYVIHIQTVSLPEYQRYKWDYNDLLKASKQIQLKYDSLLNFVFNSGLEEKFHNDYMEYWADDYDVCDYREKNEIRFSQFEQKKTQSRLIRKLEILDYLKN